MKPPPRLESRDGVGDTVRGVGRRVLIVEDERDLADVLEYNLRQAGYEPAWAAGGAAALRLIAEWKPDLVLLDLMLPDLSGLEVCRMMKTSPATAGVPVIMLTARGEEPMRVEGLESGADDYVTKPFSVRELLLRVKAVLRRHEGKSGAAEPVRTREARGALEIDREGHRAFVAGKEVALTATEFRLLLDLIDAAGRVRTRDMLLDRVWGYSPDAVTRTVDTHMRRLRQKLKRAGNMVRTVRGVGYRFSVEGTDE